jgi:hypothetical protein
MNSCDEIVKDVIECPRCELRNDLIEEYGDNCKYCSFAFYYSQQDIDKNKYKYIMIMQNFALHNNWDKEEEYHTYSRLKEGDDIIKIMQCYLKKCFKEDNKHFSEQFFNILREYHLIMYNNLEEYFDNYFLSEFIVTDLVKCRANTEKVSDRQIKTCAEYYLCKELKNYASGKLIFTFSSRTWKFLYHSEEIQPKLVNDNHNDSEQDKISNIHGMLFRSEKLNAHLIPLAHFSKRQFNYYLRNSYFNYLEDGLKKYTDGKLA